MHKIVIEYAQSDLNPQRAEIIELAMIELNDELKPTGRFYHSYFCPENEIAEDAVHILGYDKNFLSDYPSFASQRKKILQFIGKKEIIFFEDEKLFYSFQKIAQMNFHNRLICVSEIGTEILPDVPKSLKSYAKALDICPQSAFAAPTLVDCGLTAQVYSRLLAKPLNDLMSDFKFSTTPLSLSSLSEDIIREVPRKIGLDPAAYKVLGAIIGDYVGSRFEWHNHKSKKFNLIHPDCFLTDDSYMTIALFEALNQSVSENFRNLEEKAVEMMQRYGRRFPDGGYGSHFEMWIYEQNPHPYNSWGNGAAMRVSGCGLIARNLEQAIELARKVTGCTHNHPEGYKGAEATAAAVFLAKSGHSVQQIKEFITKNYYPLNFTLDEIRDTYKFDGSCQGTVPQALEAFFESTDFEDAIRNAISIGGDSDTIGAITGAVAGAYYGVPSHLAKAVNLDSFLRRTIEEFASHIFSGNDHVYDMVFTIKKIVELINGKCNRCTAIGCLGCTLTIGEGIVGNMTDILLRLNTLEPQVVKEFFDISPQDGDNYDRWDCDVMLQGIKAVNYFENLPISERRLAEDEQIVLWIKEIAAELNRYVKQADKATANKAEAIYKDLARALENMRHHQIDFSKFFSVSEHELSDWPKILKKI